MILRSFIDKTALIALLLLLVPIGILPQPAASSEKPSAPPPAKVTVAQVTEKLVAENTSIVGVVYFDKYSNLSTDVSGLVDSVSFTEGDRIQKGDIIVRLNTEFIDKDIEAVETKIRQIDVRIEKADKDLKRYHTLFQQDAASEKDYDDIGFTRRDLLQEQNSLKKQLEIARLKKTKSLIRAPFDGVVLEKYTDAGNWVAPGVCLCRIGAVEDLFVKVPIAEELLVFSKPGDTVDVTLHAWGKTVTGTVAGFVPIADPKTKNITLKIKLPKLSQAVENISASVRVATSEKKRLKMIPRDALVSFKGKPFAYTVKEGKAVILPLNIVSFIGGYAGVDSSLLQAGMDVIVDGNQRIRPDQPVKVILK